MYARIFIKKKNIMHVRMCMMCMGACVNVNMFAAVCYEVFGCMYVGGGECVRAWTFTLLKCERVDNET